MTLISEFESHLTSELRKIFHCLSTSVSIQAYLDSMPYIAEVLGRSPLRVMTDFHLHCLDGGIFTGLARNEYCLRRLCRTG